MSRRVRRKVARKGKGNVVSSFPEIQDKVADLEPQGIVDWRSLPDDTAKIVSFIIEKLKKEKYSLIFGWKEEETNKSKIKQLESFLKDLMKYPEDDIKQAEVFCIVGLLEFLYVGSAYAALVGGLGCFIATFINSVVKSLTGNSAKSQESWYLSQTINTAHRYKYRTQVTQHVYEMENIIKHDVENKESSTKISI
ncbi:hypothetical protein P8452_58672 [Trifolium repens]|nr:hypothetical protein P8452_58672 [Trifolium repens]